MEQGSACMIFQYCRSTLSPIFVADYISLLPYPNLRDHFTTAARSNLRQEVLDWNRSAPARLRHDRQRELLRRCREGRKSEIWWTSLAFLYIFDPRDRLGYHSTISARVGEVNSSTVTTLHQTAHFGLLFSPFYVRRGAIIYIYIYTRDVSTAKPTTTSVYLLLPIHVEKNVSKKGYLKRYQSRIP